MPLTGSESVLAAALKPEIVTQVKAVFTIHSNISFSEDALQKFAEAVANAVANKVIPHIIANSVTKTSVVGVQGGGSTLVNQLGIIT